MEAMCNNDHYSLVCSPEHGKLSIRTPSLKHYLNRSYTTGKRHDPCVLMLKYVYYTLLGKKFRFYNNIHSMILYKSTYMHISMYFCVYVYREKNRLIEYISRYFQIKSKRKEFWGRFYSSTPKPRKVKHPAQSSSSFYYTMLKLEN